MPPEIYSFMEDSDNFLSFLCPKLSFCAPVAIMPLLTNKNTKTMMMNLLQALFGIGTRQPEQQPSQKTSMPQEIKKTIDRPLQYRDDVEKLRSYVGDENWKPGLTIELELRDLLSICPRERRRSDAFSKLIAYLKDEQKIELKIKTKKR